MSKNFNGYLFALFAIFFWSFNVIYAKILADKLTPFEISFIRWLIPAVLFIPFTFKTILISKDIFKQNWLPLLIMALTGLGFQNTFVYYAGHTSNAVDMALIGATSPIFLLLFSALLFHRAVTLPQIIGIICAVFGVIIVILDGNLLNFKEITLTVGDLWMLLASVIFALYSIAQKELTSNVPQMASFTLMIWFSTLLFLPLALYDYTQNPHITLNHTDWFILLILAVFNSGLAYVFWNKALNNIGTVKTGTTYYLMPVFSAVEAYFFLNEQIYANQIYGALLVIGGIIISDLKFTHPDTSAPNNTYKH